jgi:hypothetical protein
MSANAHRAFSDQRLINNKALLWIRAVAMIADIYMLTNQGTVLNYDI